ncbi:HlyD family efflux transporter periplasmic adaptor subunit [Candidatus Zixiibacteriota bacterium]
MPEYFKLRPDLVIRPQDIGGQLTYIVKDPATGRFFKLREPEYFLISRMDGHTAVDAAVAAFSARFEMQLPPGAAAAFFRKMQRLCLFEGVYAEAAIARQKRQAPRTMWGRLLLWRIAAINPDRLIAKIERRTRWMFTAEFMVSAFAVIGLSLVVAGANSATFFLSFGDIIRVESIIGILAAIFVLATFHEFGHAVALKHYGGQVTEMGFLLLYFQPCVYCNLSDAYLLPGKGHKAKVMLAGLFVQLLVTAAAVFLWRITALDTLINQFAFLVAAVSLAIALFNLNPLIKLDGYYLLAGLLNMPNLRARAFGYLKRRFVELSIGRRTEHSDDRHGRLFLWYGIIALIYSVFLLGFVGYHVSVFLAERFGPAGPLVLWGAIGIVLARPLWKEQKVKSDEDQPVAAREKNGQSSTGEAKKPGEKSKRQRSKRPFIFWGTIILLIIVSFFIHAERKVGSACRVEPLSVYRIFNPEAGIIATELLAAGTRERRERTSLQFSSADFSAVEIKPWCVEGELVSAGDTVLVISSNRYLSQLAATEARSQQAQAQLNLLFSGPKEEQVRQVRAELAQVEARLDNAQAEFERAGRMHERELISDGEFEVYRTQLAVVQQAKQAKQSELSLLISDPKIEEIAIKEAEIAELTAVVEYYRSQIAASVFRAPFAGRISRARAGETILELACTDTMRVIIHISEDDIGEVNIGAPVKLKVRSYPFDMFEGQVRKLAVAPFETGSKSTYEVITMVRNTDGRLLSGMTGQAKIYCGDRPLISLILRRVVHFFRIEFWSWW